MISVECSSRRTVVLLECRPQVDRTNETFLIIVHKCLGADPNPGTTALIAQVVVKNSNFSRQIVTTYLNAFTLVKYKFDFHHVCHAIVENLSLCSIC